MPCLSPGAIEAPNVNESKGGKSVIHGDTISKLGIEKNQFPGSHLLTFKRNFASRRVNIWTLLLCEKYVKKM